MILPRDLLASFENLSNSDTYSSNDNRDKSKVSWLADIRQQLSAREQTEMTPYCDIVKTNEVLLLELCAVSERLQERESQLGKLQSLVAAPSSSSQTTQQGISYEDLKKELDKMYKVQAVNAQRVLDLSDKLVVLEADLEETRARSSQFASQLRVSELKLDDAQVLIREKERVIQLLQDELQTCQLELAKVEERLRLIENENRTLTERWLRLKNDEADKMNQANSFYESIVEKTRNKISEGSRRITSMMVGDSLHNKSALQKSQSSPLDQSMMSASASNLLGFSATRSMLEGSSQLSLSKLRPGLTKSTLPSTVAKYAKIHEDQINSVSISYDGAFLATAGVDKNVKVYDCSSFNLKYTLTGCLQSVMCTDFSMSNEYVLASSNDNSIRIWTVETGRPKFTLTGHIGNVWAARFSADAKRVISGSHDRTLKLWDLQRGTCVRSIFTISSVNDLCLTDDAGVISGHLDNVVRFWDTKTGDCVKEISGIHAGQITSVSVSPDSYQILTCSRDNTMKLVDIRTFSVLNTFSTEGFVVGLNHSKACFSSDGSFVAAGSLNGHVYVFHTFVNTKKDSEPAAILDKHTAPVTAVAWHPNGSNLFSVDKASFMSIWQ